MLAAASPQTGQALSQDQIQASYLISYFAVMDYSPVLLVVGVDCSITCLVVDSLKAQEPTANSTWRSYFRFL